MVGLDQPSGGAFKFARVDLDCQGSVGQEAASVINIASSDCLHQLSVRYDVVDPGFARISVGMASRLAWLPFTFITSDSDVVPSLVLQHAGERRKGISGSI